MTDDVDLQLLSEFDIEAALEQQDPDTRAMDEDQIALEVRRLLLHHEAKERFHRALAAREVGEADLDVATLNEILARPPEAPYRAQGLIPSDASTLVVAQRKTGKTVLLLNLAHSLITGEPFLGRFEVLPVEGTVALLNYEVSAPQVARWAAQVGIPEDRFVLVNLRGCPNPLGSPTHRARLATRLRSHGVETVMVDPFANAFTGSKDIDAVEVRRFLSLLDVFARTEVGARDLVLSAHAGWNGERTRGSSALEDWADSILTMATKKDAEKGGPRFLHAFGRDVDVSEDRLHFDESTKRLSLTGAGSRRQSAVDDKVNELMDDVIQAVHQLPGMNSSQLEDRLRKAGKKFQKGAPAKAAQRAAERRFIRVEDHGPGKPTCYFPAERPGWTPPP